MIKAIETEYKGYRFRSRLEARWAVFFDALGIAWEYEKEGYDLGEAGWYLPDFWLPEFKCFVEIKGTECPDEDRAKCEALHNESKFDVFIAQGNIGEHQWIEFGSYTTTKNYQEKDHKDRPLPYAFERKDLEYAGPFGLMVKCPVCGFDYVHIHKPSYQESDDYTAWLGRGNAVRVPMWCESGHTWELRLGFHKGQTFIAYENIQGNIYCPPDKYWHEHATDIRNKVPLETAYNAARSARFEHGEHGTR